MAPHKITPSQIDNAVGLPQHMIYMLSKLPNGYCYMQGATYEQPGLIFPTPNHTIQILEVTITFDRSIEKAIQMAKVQI